MSIFHCAQCDRLSDADDGCDEAAPGSFDLICIDCMDAREEEAEIVLPSAIAKATGESTQ